jgi:hypothetical protein
MTTRSNPTNATEMKIRENEIIQRRGKQIMKRLPFEINQIILTYLEDGRGVNIMMLQSWRIFMASTTIKSNPLNDALNRRYRKTEVAYRYGKMCDDVIYMRRMTSLSSTPTSEELRDFFNKSIDDSVALETQIRDMIMSSDFFPHIGRYEYIRLILEGNRGEATIIIAQTPTHHNDTGVYETRELTDDNAIAEYGKTVRQIYNSYKLTDDGIRHKNRWIAEFDPEILYEIFQRFPQDVRIEMRDFYEWQRQHLPDTDTIGHARANSKLLFHSSGVLTVEEIRYLQGSELGRCLLLPMILLDIGDNGRKTYMWNLEIFQAGGGSYYARGNFKIFLIELSRIWGLGKMLNEAYRWRKTIDEANGQLNSYIPRVWAYNGIMLKVNPIFGLEYLDYEDEDEDDDGDGGNY